MGILAFECCTGEPPYPEGLSMDDMRKRIDAGETRVAVENSLKTRGFSSEARGFVLPVYLIPCIYSSMPLPPALTHTHCIYHIMFAAFQRSMKLRLHRG